MVAAVLGQDDDIVMVDLEQQYWPWLWWPGWPPLAIWVHVILTLQNADSTRAGKHALPLQLAGSPHYVVADETPLTQCASVG